MRLKRTKVLFFIGAALTLFYACSLGPKVLIQVEKPASLYLPGVREIAIVDFHGPDYSGGQIATLIQSKLMSTAYFDIMERDKLQSLLDEQKLGQTGIIDESTAAEVGKMLGVDAMIFGSVATYEVEPDEKGVQKVERKVGTGQYEWVEQYNIFKGKKEKVKREIMKTVLVDQRYKIRRGTVAINFRVVGVETGRLLAAHSDSKSYDSGKVVEGSYQSLKPEGQILSELSDVICESFVRMIAPYKSSESRTIQTGKTAQLGVQFARNGLWPEAIKAWQAALELTPDDPVLHYDLGLAYEVQGMLEMAEKEYEKAVGFSQKSLYMQALVRVRQAKEEQAELKRQLLDRDQ